MKDTKLIGIRVGTVTVCVHVGPGLAVRVLGDVTEGDALDVLRQVDEVYVQCIRDYGLYDKIWQAFAVFLPIRLAPLLCFWLQLTHTICPYITIDASYAMHHAPYTMLYVPCIIVLTAFLPVTRQTHAAVL